MEKPNFPNSARKHIRRQKAALRRSQVDGAERAQALAKVYAKFGYIQDPVAQEVVEEKGAAKD